MASRSASRPMPLRRRRDEHGREDRLADALVEARVELRVGDLLLAEVLLEHRVVGLGRGLEQLVAASGDLVGDLGGDGDLDLLAALEPVGLAVDEVDVAGERVGGADREVQRRDLVAEHAAQLVQGAARVRVLAVALVEHEAGRRVGRPADARPRPPGRTRHRPRRPSRTARHRRRGSPGSSRRRSPGSRACRRP